MILGGKACCGVNCFLNIVGLSDVAGGSVAYFDNIFAFLVHREIFVESCNAVKLGFAFADLFRNIFQRVLRQEFILVLDLLMIAMTLVLSQSYFCSTLSIKPKSTFTK